MNVGKSTAIEAFMDVVDRLYELRNDYIKFPTTVAETSASIATYMPLSNPPNIAGAIDGTHIKIKTAKNRGVDYLSRYQQNDVAVQALVSGKGAFMGVAAGFPGSMHDARVLRNSITYEKVEHGDILAAGPIHRVDRSEIQPYLVGDSAHPLSPWLQKPFPEGTRDPDEIRFNQELSSARVQVECAFGILKSRWRILMSMEESKVQLISKIILAFAFLHNFCILHGDDREWEENDENNDHDQGDSDEILRDGDNIREIVKVYLSFFNVITKIKSLHFNYRTTKIGLKSLGLVSYF